MRGGKGWWSGRCSEISKPELKSSESSKSCRALKGSADMMNSRIDLFVRRLGLCYWVLQLLKAAKPCIDDELSWKRASHFPTFSGKPPQACQVRYCLLLRKDSGLDLKNHEGKERPCKRSSTNARARACTRIHTALYEAVPAAVLIILLTKGVARVLCKSRRTMLGLVPVF